MMNPFLPILPFSTFNHGLLWCYLQHSFHGHRIEFLTVASALPFFVKPVSNGGEAETFVFAQDMDVANQFLVSNNGRFPLHPRPFQLRFVGQVVGCA